MHQNMNMEKRLEFWTQNIASMSNAFKGNFEFDAFLNFLKILEIDGK